MQPPDPKISQLFCETPSEQHRQWAQYARHLYAQGLPLADIAIEVSRITQQKVHPEQLRNWMKQADFADYRQAVREHKENTLTKEMADCRRILSLGRSEIIKRLESGEAVTVRDLCSIEKTYGDREALISGRATQHVNLSGQGITVVLSDTVTKSKEFNETDIQPNVD